MSIKRSRNKIDMLNGNLFPKLALFAAPIAFATIMQIMFSAADMFVVGYFNGEQSLAAVGATTILMYLFVNLFISISTGVNICAADAFARKDSDAAKKLICTTPLFAIVTGIVISAAGIIFSGPALRLMQTPDDIFSSSLTYIRICFAGTPFCLLFNFAAGIMRGNGDSVRPTRYLIISGAANTVLNIIFVGVFSLGVAGVALATVISQALSCVFAMRVLINYPQEYRFRIDKNLLSFDVVKSSCRLGIPPGIHVIAFNISNALFQSTVNTFGTAAVAAFAVAHAMFGVICAPLEAIGSSCTTFTAQNYSAGKHDRVYKVLKNSILLEFLGTETVAVVLFVFQNVIFKIFLDTPESAAAAREIVSVTVLFYIIPSVSDCFMCTSYGLKHTGLPTAASVISIVGFRVLWLLLFVPSHRSLFSLFLSYPLSWTLMLIMQFIVFRIISQKTIKKSPTV